jgi:phospholipid/cholesterol/gamma-HCH transport system substrate-binding protein
MRRSRVLTLGLLTALLSGGCSLVPGGGDGGMEITAYFDRAVSLYDNSKVKVLGLPAGRVTGIEPEGDQIRVTLQIDEGVPIPADARAAIVPQSLIGERYVQLFPAWTDGQPEMVDGTVLERDRTQVPVEADEALQALKDFLDALDPDGAGRLIDNAATALEGNGERLGSALSNLADLQKILADKDQVLLSLTEQLDNFSATLLTRESQLGEAMDLFAEVTGALAEERAQIEGLVSGLATVSGTGLDLLTRNAEQLRTDIDNLTTTLRTVQANLGAVQDLVESGDDFPAGLANAFDPEHRRIDLRVDFSPLVTSILDTVPGLPPGVCLPIDVQCGRAPEGGGSVQGRAGSAAVAAPLVPARSPVDDVLDLLGAEPTVAELRPSRSFAERVGDAAGSASGAVRGAAAALLGVGS